MTDKINPHTGDLSPSEYLKQIDQDPANPDWSPIVSTWHRIDLNFAKLLQKAMNSDRRETHLEDADLLRRETAKIFDPSFPEEWGKPISKHWIRTLPHGEEVTSPVMPKGGKHLTIWRFNGFEATATFDHPEMIPFDEDPTGPRSSAVAFNRSRMGSSWHYAGPTDNHSSLWWRGLKGGATP